MDEFLVEASEEDAEEAGKLMCEAYKYASDKCFEWHKENQELFANSSPVLFPFDLDGGYKVGTDYLQTH